ncbi:MAG TPA: ATP synthase F1 subunit epsilon [Thermoanaerobaculia bacterium]|nr:ATP synthase F1 subunit epsilon [Thermoanaerobaculia bacterium]
MADLPTSLTLNVVTRERKVLEAQVQEIVLPAWDGEIGVLPGHTPLLTTLKIGQMWYRTGTNIQRLVLSAGFAEVLPDRVIVLAENAKLAVEIDAAAAEIERMEAEKELAYLSSQDPEFAVVEARLEESVAMINVHREHH